MRDHCLDAPLTRKSDRCTASTPPGPSRRQASSPPKKPQVQSVDNALAPEPRSIALGVSWSFHQWRCGCGTMDKRRAVVVACATCWKPGEDVLHPKPISPRCPLSVGPVGTSHKRVGRHREGGAFPKVRGASGCSRRWSPAWNLPKGRAAGVEETVVIRDGGLGVRTGFIWWTKRSSSSP